MENDIIAISYYAHVEVSHYDKIFGKAKKSEVIPFKVYQSLVV